MAKGRTPKSPVGSPRRHVDIVISRIACALPDGKYDGVYVSEIGANDGDVTSIHKIKAMRQIDVLVDYCVKRVARLRGVSDQQMKTLIEFSLVEMIDRGLVFLKRIARSWFWKVVHGFQMNQRAREERRLQRIKEPTPRHRPHKEKTVLRPSPTRPRRRPDPSFA